jgi:hypothetical protein
MMRNRIMLMRFVMAITVFMGLISVASADEKTSYDAASSPDKGTLPREWNGHVSFGYLPAADFHGIPGDAAISDYRLKISRSFKVDDKLTLSLGGGYGLKHLDASSVADLPQDLHALFMEVGANYRFSERAFASLRLSPGFYSDFKSLGSDDVRMPVLALGGYTFENGWSVVGGFIYRPWSRFTQFMPALGFSYQPNEYWRIDMVAPRPSITYSASRQLQLFVAGDFASDEYELEGQAFGAKAIKYSDFKVMAGVGISPVPALKISASVGYAFDRKFEFYDTLRSDLRLDNVPFFRVSLDVGW